MPRLADECAFRWRGCGAVSDDRPAIALATNVQGGPLVGSIQTYAEDASHSAARTAVGLYCSGTVARRAAITPGSTRLAPSSAETKFWSFSRNAHNFATQRSSLSRHQPVNCGPPPAAAVLAFCTLTNLAPEQFAGDRFESAAGVPQQGHVGWAAPNGEICSCPAMGHVIRGRAAFGVIIAMAFGQVSRSLEPWIAPES